MLRTVLSLAALTLFLAAPAVPADAGQASHPDQKTDQKPVSRSRRSSARPTFTGVLNINSASASDLEGLPGIGAKTAQRIVEYRQKNGPFKKVEELMNVRGIGEKNFLKLKSQLSVGAAKTDSASAR
jgi:competence protein ComEA